MDCKNRKSEEITNSSWCKLVKRGGNAHVSKEKKYDKEEEEKEVEEEVEEEEEEEEEEE